MLSTVPEEVPIYGDVPVSTGTRKRNKRAVAPGHLKTGNFYKLNNTNKLAVAA